MTDNGPSEAVLQPGMVVIGCVRTPKERPGVDNDKWRPTIVLGPAGQTRMMVLGLTTKSTYETGDQRTPLHDWDLIPLPTASYLWSPKPAILPLRDLGRVVGTISARDVELIIVYATLAPSTAAALRARVAD